MGERTTVACPREVPDSALCRPATSHAATPSLAAIGVLDPTPASLLLRRVARLVVLRRLADRAVAGLAGRRLGHVLAFLGAAVPAARRLVEDARPEVHPDLAVAAAASLLALGLRGQGLTCDGDLALDFRVRMLGEAGLIEVVDRGVGASRHDLSRRRLADARELEQLVLALGVEVHLRGSARLRLGLLRGRRLRPA